MPRFNFPIRPLVCSVSDAAGEAEKAFINLNRYTIYDGEQQSLYNCPSLFISDGMSIPDILQSKIQGEDGIIAGHIHDMLYSAANAELLDEMADRAETEDARALADQVLEDYLQQHCPGFRSIEATQAKLAVRLFGGRAFRDQEQDAWRQRVAKMLGSPPGKGLGVQEADNYWTLGRTIKELQERHL